MYDDPKYQPVLESNAYFQNKYKIYIGDIMSDLDKEIKRFKKVEHKFITCANNINGICTLRRSGFLERILDNIFGPYQHYVGCYDHYILAQCGKCEKYTKI